MGLLAAAAEAANLAVNGTGGLPWPGLAQIGAAYVVFVSLIVLAGTAGPSASELDAKAHQEPSSTKAIGGNR